MLGGVSPLFCAAFLLLLLILCKRPLLVSPKGPALLLPGGHVNGVRLGRGLAVLPPHLDGLVCLCRNEAAARGVKGRGKDARFGVQAAGLGLAGARLEGVPRAIVPQLQAAVIPPPTSTPSWLRARQLTMLPLGAPPLRPRPP